MAGRLCSKRLFIGEYSIFNANACIIKRNTHYSRGKPPGEARNLQQRLDELNKKDPSITYRVDIGFPYSAKSKQEQLYERLAHLKKQRHDTELERLARTKQLQVDLSEVQSDWLRTCGPFHIRRIADHYGVYEHLFGDAYFIPRIPLSAYFEQPNGDLSPVYYGNTIKPDEAKIAPIIKYEGEKDALYTLILTNPDGHFSEENAEYVHLFIGNIPGSDVTKGETIVPYLQPIPPKGTGYHRHIFVLYKQDKKLDYSKLKVTDSLDLSKRTFRTLEFYRERQDFITPAGLCFFQSDWDTSLTSFYHQSLGMEMPIFEYDFPPPYIKRQTWFPLREPFNIYMDKYRDPKQINKEYLVQKLKEVHPFKPPAEKLKFPNAQRFERGVPSWLKEKIRRDRSGYGRINEIS